MTTDHVEAHINTDSLFFASIATPPAIARVESDLKPTIQSLARDISSRPNAHLYFVGGGASLSAMDGAKYLLDRFTSVSATVCTGWQFVSRSPFALGPDAFVFLTSYSGQTPEVLQARDLAREQGATVIAITDTPHTPLAQGADHVLDFQSKAVFTAPLAIVYHLAAAIMLERDESASTGSHILTQLPRLPELIEPVIERTRAGAREQAAEFATAEMFYVLGSGPLYGLAYKLALSVIIENLWLDAAAVDAGEFYHGPIEIVSPSGAARDRRAFLHLVGTDPSRTVSEQAISFLQGKGARQLIYDAAYFPEFGELFSPFVLFVPTEWFIMYMSAQKAHDVDERRYMGKIGSRWGEYATV